MRASTLAVVVILVLVGLPVSWIIFNVVLGLIVGIAR
jgi:hypothetical protein